MLSASLWMEHPVPLVPTQPEPPKAPQGSARPWDGKGLCVLARQPPGCGAPAWEGAR